MLDYIFMANVSKPDNFFNIKYLHFIGNARLKSIRLFERYLPITARSIDVEL